MHKSLGNFWTASDALGRWEPEVLRFFFLNAHYRSPADFTSEAMDEAGRSYDRLRETVRTLEAERRRAQPTGRADASLRAATARALEAFDAAMSDDFNTREALAIVFEFAREANRVVETGAGKAALDEAVQAFATFGKVLGLFAGPSAEAGLAEDVMDLVIALREDARKRKDFTTADRIREDLAALGIVLEDTRDGVRWKRK
jgi:cysteinyl-tRNA synthetase